MNIIKLDIPYFPSKNKSHVSASNAPVHTPEPKKPQVFISGEIEPKPKAEAGQKEKLLRQLEEEDSYIRYQRALAHRKYFDLLGPDLKPIARDVDFSLIYDEIDQLTDRLQFIWIKRQEVEKTGMIKERKFLTDSTLKEIAALKHERGNTYKNIFKWKKKLQEAELKNSAQLIKAASTKLELFELRILDITHRIKTLEANV